MSIPRRRTATLLVTVALVVTIGWLGLSLRAHADRAADGRAAAAAAGDVVTLLWTVDAETSRSVYASLLGSTTGSLRTQLSQYAGTFQQVLTTQKVTSGGSVVQTGVAGLHGHTATVLVAARAEDEQAVSTATVPAVSVVDGDGKHVRVLMFVDQQTSDTRKKNVVSLSRVQVTMSRAGGRWLVADLRPI